MSHISRIKTKIVEKEHLLKALDDLGYTYQEGDLEVKGMGTKQKVEILIPLKISYDIGFRKSEGSYEIIADWYGVRGVKSKEFTEKLTQRYAYHAAKQKLEEQGFTLIEETQDKGKIHLVLRRAA